MKREERQPVMGLPFSQLTGQHSLGRHQISQQLNSNREEITSTIPWYDQRKKI
jgi:hypothetical protein